MFITEIEKDTELSLALAQFSARAAVNAVPLGLNPGNLTEISTAATGFATSLTTLTTAKAAATAAKEAKDAQKAASKAVVSKWAKVFRANVGVSDAILAELLLPPHSNPGSETTPTTPYDLTATANGNGDIQLRWNRAGNIQTTTFQIEFRTSAAAPWTILDSTTRRSYFTSWNPGQYVAFRVRAVRRGVGSSWSTPVILWDTEESAQLQLAA